MTEDTVCQIHLNNILKILKNVLLQCTVDFQLQHHKVVTAHHHSTVGHVCVHALQKREDYIFLNIPQIVQAKDVYVRQINATALLIFMQINQNKNSKKTGH